MSDNIEFNKAKGTHSFAYRGEVPWHKKGQPHKNYMTSAEAIKDCNGDYEVALAPNYALLNWVLPSETKRFDNIIKLTEANGKVNYYNTALNPTSYTTYRKDTNAIFNTVGTRYEVVQNIEAFNFIDSIVQTGEAVIETAGVIGQGEQIFVVAKLPNYITLGNGDVIESYIFITMRHDGQGMVTAALTGIRIVCNNTLRMALRNCTNRIQFKHTKNVHDKLDKGAELMGLSNIYHNELSETLAAMKKATVTDEQVLDVVYKLYLDSKELAIVEKANGEIGKVNEISTRKKNLVLNTMLSIDGGAGQDLHRGSALWLYNGVTTYLSNVKSYNSEEDRLLSLTQGSEEKLSQKAFDLSLNLV